MDLLQQMISSGEMSTIKRERLGRELLDAIGGKAPWRFFEVLHECGALRALNLPIPDLPHALDCLQRAVAITGDSVVRVAVALYQAAADAGTVSLEEALRLPADYTRLLDMLLSQADVIEPVAHADADVILRLITELRAEQQPDRFEQFLQAAIALWPDLMQRAKPNLTQAMEALTTVSASDLQQQGLSGRELGVELKRLRLQAIRSCLSA
jgi:tRNA nucleotidyltransferase (CCA-adding enzyme)